MATSHPTVKFFLSVFKERMIRSLFVDLFNYIKGMWREYLWQSVYLSRCNEMRDNISINQYNLLSCHQSVLLYISISRR